MKKDKFYYGFIYGVFAGVVQNALNLLLFYLGITTLRYLDWVSVMSYGHEPLTTFDGIFAMAIQLGINGVLGSLFAYILPILGFEHHLLKGIVFGTSFYQLSYFITTLYNIPSLAQTTTYTAMSNLITASIFGMVLSTLVKQLLYDCSG